MHKRRAVNVMTVQHCVSMACALLEGRAGPAEYGVQIRGQSL